MLGICYCLDRLSVAPKRSNNLGVHLTKQIPYRSVSCDSSSFEKGIFTQLAVSYTHLDVYKRQH